MFQILEIFQVVQHFLCFKIFQILNCCHLSHNINKLCFLMRPRLIDGDLNFFIGRTSKTFGKTRKTRWFCVGFLSVGIFDGMQSSFQYVTLSSVLPQSYFSEVRHWLVNLNKSLVYWNRMKCLGQFLGREIQYTLTNVDVRVFIIGQILKSWNIWQCNGIGKGCHQKLFSEKLRLLAQPADPHPSP